MKQIEIEIPKGFEIDNEKSTKDKIIFKYCGKQFVDLGLPSGTLWASEPEEGCYTFDKAVKQFSDKLPTIVDFAELAHYCKWEWKNKSMVVTGPNGNSVTLPALGFRNSGSGALYGVGDYGCYWSASPHPSNTNYAYYLRFHYSGYVIPASHNFRSYGYSVCLIKRK